MQSGFEKEIRNELLLEIGALEKDYVIIKDVPEIQVPIDPILKQVDVALPFMEMFP